MCRFDFEDVTVARPHLKAAPDRAVGADSLGPFRALVAHLRLHLGERENRPVADRRLDPLDHIDHVVERALWSIGQIARLSEHRLLHQGVAWAYSDAVASGDAA